ncbi:hypothetical protein NQ318_001021 [Aromia moschata]|uniref:Large ribosomal subunit protein mL54 n=1 Tax=Aromia moschata TaxID=1265417 RepID=A0AAV8ZDY4_9CUCU|nr:hypothetical protein NQ318_001021 [Aromia moschata]
MSSSIYALLLRRSLLITSQISFPRKTYAKKDTGSVSMIGGALKKKKLETDPEKLVKYVCGSNIYKTGEDILLKPDSEYPDWLWSIRTGPAPPLEELDPNSRQYWKRIRKMGMKRNNQLGNLKNQLGPRVVQISEDLDWDLRINILKKKCR